MLTQKRLKDVLQYKKVSKLMNRMSKIDISQESFSKIEQVAQEFNLSVSELLENISQGQLTVIDSEQLEDLIDLQAAIEAENNPENQERVSWEVIKQNLSIK